MFGSIGAALGSVAGSLLDRQEQRHNAKQQYVYNSWLQSQNENFQKYMASNAHQMEVDDLKKAGLNPILSAMGSSAGSIAGSSAPQGTSAGNAPSNFSQGLQNALATIQTNSTKDLNKKLGEKAEAEANHTNKNAGWINKKAENEIENLKSQTAVNSAKKEALEAERGLTIEKTRTEAVKDMTKKQIRNMYHSNKTAKEESKKINKLYNTGHQEEAERMILLGY